ncbi:MAG: 16S rRNA (adenine(1518)-N(6)/adenine(1519)-N(6))-dimethyltransferase RsmA [Lentisphaerae bacterium]|nr:16S rRNA (adenine(1518)-N(6)/adenine(1519)-N(6))-dimethyltransferase RsmA [Lentisphaerota bacterium]
MPTETPDTSSSPAADDVLRPSQVQRLLAELDFRPHKSLGQNFLVDRNILDHLMASAAIEPTDTVLEIGPGLGAVTQALLARARRVLAVEKDPRLYAFLRRRFGGAAHFHLIEGDMLDASVDALAWPGEGLVRIDRVVSNLPYSVGSRILVDLVRAVHRPRGIVVTVQKEVAERLAGGPGGGSYGLLSIWVQRAYEVTLVRTIGPRCFLPEPEVKSAIVRLQARTGEAAEPLAFYALSRQAFAQRRKQIARTLATGGRTPEAVRAALALVGATPLARPEELTPPQWSALVKALER